MKATRTREQEIRLELAFLANQSPATGYHPQEIAYMRTTCLAELQRLATQPGTPSRPATRRRQPYPALVTA